MSRKTIFITGAASGIGRATALQFHERGWFVGGTDVDEPGLATYGATKSAVKSLTEAMSVELAENGQQRVTSPG